MKLKTDAGSLFQPLPNPRIELTAAELATLRKASEILGRIVALTEADDPDSEGYVASSALLANGYVDRLIDLVDGRPRWYPLALSLNL